MAMQARRDFRRGEAQGQQPLLPHLRSPYSPPLSLRFCPTADIRVEAGVVTVEGLSEQDSVQPPSPPAAGAPQEVTYAQLDHHRLAQRAAPAGSPQPPETKAQSSMYADLAWH
ncbi:leukocyte-associated immunoglobulin-like receptor 1 [Erinaceus europaeus]|uniref:Leukocyte-associated immunoglobulin-like receptor 1 n=1 Tax=Erinaceus europaeus TaxID=9365 RepID=A0ABM3VXK9_ERIEU|nr:leukocyte-associated immunoglobulin-like receptor 1 [Erinaceus europaeus]